MFRLPATSVVFLGSVLSAATCPAAGQVLPANDEKAWQEAELKQLAGRWTTFREEKADQDKISRRRVNLEFVDGKLKVSFFDEKGVKVRDGSLTVIGVEHVGTTSRLKLHYGELYYDFVGEKLIVIGWPAPWAFPPLSGEYKRSLCW
jgi:hypothetical protein